MNKKIILGITIAVLITATTVIAASDNDISSGIPGLIQKLNDLIKAIQNLKLNPTINVNNSIPVPSVNVNNQVPVPQVIVNAPQGPQGIQGPPGSQGNPGPAGTCNCEITKADYDALVARVAALESQVCVDGTTRDCYPGPAGTQGVGVCKAGTQTCADGRWSACQGAVIPSAEICNGLDDDCDGLVDENPNTLCPVSNAVSTCQNGACVITSCIAGYGNCNGNSADGCEQDLSTSNNNCGLCGNVCPNRANAIGQCSNSMCGITCNAGYGDCNGNSADGCEINLMTSTNHCGACANVCPIRANSVAQCSNSVCGFTCNAGYGDCNGSPVDGCEINLMTSTSHCGACGLVCLQGHSCVSGACVI
jgi:hypothetical protein